MVRRFWQWLIALICPSVRKLRAFDTALAILTEEQPANGAAPDPTEGLGERRETELRIAAQYLQSEGLLIGLFDENTRFDRTNFLIGLTVGTGPEDADRVSQAATDLIHRLKIRRRIVEAQSRCMFALPSAPARGVATAITPAAPVPLAGAAASPPETPDPPPGGAGEEPDKPRTDLVEDALLGRATDRLYGSWAFRLTGLALVTCVVLAAGGTFLIGGQELRLSGKLDDLAAKAEENMKKQLAASNQAIKDKTDQFSEKLDASQAQLTERFRLTQDRLTQKLDKANADAEKALQTIADLKNKADTIKKEAVDSIVAAIEEKLKNQSSEVWAEVNRVFTSAKARSTAIQGALDDAERDVADKKRKLRDIDADMPKVFAYLGELKGLTEKLNTIEADRKTVHEAAIDAADKLKIAQLALAEIERQREALAAKVKPVDDQASASQRTLDRVSGTVAAIESHAGGIDKLLNQTSAQATQQQQRLAATEADIRPLEARLPALRANLERAAADLERLRKALDGPPVPEGEIDAIRKRIEAIKKAIAEIEIPKPPTSPPPASDNCPASEKDLTVAGWKRIQQGLVTQGHPLQKIDGIAKGKTRAAIVSFQRRRNEQGTGTLTSAQLCDLWKSQSAAR